MISTGKNVLFRELTVLKAPLHVKKILLKKAMEM